MKRREMYCRMMYSMAYISAMAIVVFEFLEIPNTIMIALSISFLVAAGFLSINRSAEGDSIIPRDILMEGPTGPLTTIDEEFADAAPEKKEEHAA